MKGRPDCPICDGRGVVLDPDPMQPARPCACAQGSPEEDGEVLAIPLRYRGSSHESFWEWWKIQHPREKMITALGTAHQLLEHEGIRETLPEELRSKLDLIVHKCGPRPGVGGELAWKDLRPAQEPLGYRGLIHWGRQHRDPLEDWWIDGPPGSGRSSLAAAALKAWCVSRGKPGLFISVRAFSQELKDTYYDLRSYKNVDFLSERDRMAPLLKAPCLVLDDLDRMDTDIRVVRSMAQLLDERYAQGRCTIITASRWCENLLTPEVFPLTKLEDGSLLRRLAGAKRVHLRPTLDRLMESLHG